MSHMLEPICGQDGISHNILGAPMYIEKVVISGIPDLDDKIYNKTGISALDKFTYLSFE